MSGTPRPFPRSRLDDSDERLARKKHLEEAGLTLGLVEIPGPLPPRVEQEIREVAARLAERDAARYPGAALLSVTAFQEGLAIETKGEKLAQHIADHLARSRKATVERAFDDEGRRRILTCRLPAAEGGA